MPETIAEMEIGKNVGKESPDVVPIYEIMELEMRKARFMNTGEIPSYPVVKGLVLAPGDGTRSGTGSRGDGARGYRVSPGDRVRGGSARGSNGWIQTELGGLQKRCKPFCP